MSIFDCPHRGGGGSKSCPDHNEDAGVICSSGRDKRKLGHVSIDDYKCELSVVKWSTANRVNGVSGASKQK